MDAFILQVHIFGVSAVLWASYFVVSSDADVLPAKERERERVA